ncbi:MAG: hypothetical protein D4R65_02960 [Verrucomicrobiaceae bacterium]|nr:MAG: hypothetical protein D4R65_02960 [Verrucomicrobiaceae bacterium]
MNPSPFGARNSKLPGGKISVSPRKESLIGGEATPRLHLVPEEPVWERENRIRPKSPKIPFQEPLKTEVTPGPDPALLPKAKSRTGHSLPHFFRSRRKGRYRVINFLVLPLAVLLTFLLIIVILKFL